MQMRRLIAVSYNSLLSTVSAQHCSSVSVHFLWFYRFRAVEVLQTFFLCIILKLINSASLAISIKFTPALSGSASASLYTHQIQILFHFPYFCHQMIRRPASWGPASVLQWASRWTQIQSMPQDAQCAGRPSILTADLFWELSESIPPS